MKPIKPRQIINIHLRTQYRIKSLNKNTFIITISDKSTVNFDVDEHSASRIYQYPPISLNDWRKIMMLRVAPLILAATELGQCRSMSSPKALINQIPFPMGIWYLLKALMSKHAARAKFSFIATVMRDGLPLLAGLTIRRGRLIITSVLIVALSRRRLLRCLHISCLYALQ